ncbi:E3 ubiquitin-protein ligase UPL4 [Linum grandiflorum]
MGNRGQKRSEVIDELPADKRACSSLDFRPSSSNSSVQAQMTDAPDAIANVAETPVADMDTSSSHSASSQSEEEHERDSAYGSCDSDDADPRQSSLRNYQRQRSSGDHGRLRSILTNMNEGSESSAKLAALTQLCEVLAFCTEDSLSTVMADSLSPVLVRCARDESNPDIMLLAIRALTYLCDVFPRASSFLVGHDAVPALCQRLMNIEYLDVAEQCLQALEKISRDQPLPCLQAGAVMAVLSFIDFFSTSVQRVALSTVVNVCKKLPTECPAPLMEAVPILCNLLQYEDRQLVENAASCLIKIVERVSHSSEMLDDLCKHGLINQATHLVQVNSRTTLSQPIYISMIGLLAKLSSGSLNAFKALYDLNISSILKEILSNYDLSHGICAPHVVDGQGNQVHEVLKLLIELLPSVTGDQDVQQPLSDKHAYLNDHPDHLHKLGSDIIPLLVQVVNSGANLYVCYGCLTVINKLVYFCKADMLAGLLKDANVPSFIAGVFTRKDIHVLVLALQISERILQKVPEVCLNSFIKEGIFFAIDALLDPDKCSSSIFPGSNGFQLPLDSGQKHASKATLRCLCYSFDTNQSPSTSEAGACKLEKDSVQTLARHIRGSYCTPGLDDSDEGMTDILQNLRAMSIALDGLMSKDDFDPLTRGNESFDSLLQKIMGKLSGKEPVSTFEFIESGIVRSLANYLSKGLYFREKMVPPAERDYIHAIERSGVLARVFSLSTDLKEGLMISLFIQKLQSALSSLESFPVILSQPFRQRNYFATVPHGRVTPCPCLRVRFKKDKEEMLLRGYSEDVVSVDPFVSLSAIQGYLLPKIRITTDQVQSAAQAVEPMEGVELQVPLNGTSGQGESSGTVEADNTTAASPVVQEDQAKLSQSSSENGGNLQQRSAGQSSSAMNDLSDSVELGEQSPSRRGVGSESCFSTSSHDREGVLNLAFYMDGQRLDQTSTLYQAILQQKIRSDLEINVSANFWSQVYTITYRVATEPGDGSCQGSQGSFQPASILGKNEAGLQYVSYFHAMFGSELVSDVDKSSPTYDMLFLLKCLEGLNRCTFHLMSRERMHSFAKGLIHNFDDIKVVVHSASQNEFVNSKLTEKLEQQMRDSIALSTGGLPLWCNQLMASCPFLFGFDARCKYFRLSAFGTQRTLSQLQPHNNSGVSRDRRLLAGNLPRKKFLVSRDQILDSAARMMDLYNKVKTPVEIEYNEEVGTGLGPTLEFYTLVAREFQKSDLLMWRGKHSSSTVKDVLTGHSDVVSPTGLFPCPIPPMMDVSNGTQFSEISKKFVLLGQIVAKALQDGRVLDLPFSKAFYKLILNQELNICDIPSFDPELGRALLEFQALVNRKKLLESDVGDNSSAHFDACFRNTRIEDLCLDFTLPGYPDYALDANQDNKMVNMDNLEEYVTLVVDATVCSGITRQTEAFKSGFNQVFPIEHLKIFTEEELERLLCGEPDFWSQSNELVDLIKFDHGYTASSPPVVNLLEIIQEFDYEKRRSFIQFVTGAPRLPPGGLASLNPKLTIVRKHCSGSSDGDLPSVMTCANYLKLPPYSSKEKMKEKLIYAITEGQGSFHLS